MSLLAAIPAVVLEMWVMEKLGIWRNKTTKRMLAGALGIALQVIWMGRTDVSSPIMQYILVLTNTVGLAVGSRKWWFLILGLIFSGGSIALDAWLGELPKDLKGTVWSHEALLFIAISILAGLCIGYLIKPLAKLLKM